MITESSERPLAAYGAGGQWTYGLCFAEFAVNCIYSLTPFKGECFVIERSGHLPEHSMETNLNHRCPVCWADHAKHHKTIETAEYCECISCGSIFADAETIKRAEAGTLRPYDESYWAEEITAARSRSYGSIVTRVGEVFLYARRPISRFLDISCGGGMLLDAIEVLAPEISERFYGIEPFPPPEQYRTKSPRFQVGFIDSLEGRFDAGVCIEVIEHLAPTVLRSLVRSLARKSNPQALYYFNSAQPSYVKEIDPGYIDPFKRGHVVSYSIAGVTTIFAEAGFTVLPIPGRSFGFLAEYGQAPEKTPDAVMSRIWAPDSENAASLRGSRFGNLLYSSAVEAAQMYFYQFRLKALR